MESTSAGARLPKRGERDRGRQRTGRTRTWRSLATAKDPEFLTTVEAAELLRIPTWTLLDRCRRGLLPRSVASRVGRVYRWNRVRLMAWLDGGGDMPTAAKPPEARAARR